MNCEMYCLFPNFHGVEGSWNENGMHRFPDNIVVLISIGIEIEIYSALWTDQTSFNNNCRFPTLKLFCGIIILSSLFTFENDNFDTFSFNNVLLLNNMLRLSKIV